MYPRAISIRVLNKVVEELRTGPLWAERHSYSIRIMYNGVFVASLHLYPGLNEAVLKLYGPQEVNNYVKARVELIASKYLQGFKINVITVNRSHIQRL